MKIAITGATGQLGSVVVQKLKEKTAAGFYHSSAIVDSGEIANDKEVKALQNSLR